MTPQKAELCSFAVLIPLVIVGCGLTGLAAFAQASPPPPPTNVKAAGGNAKVSLWWVASAGATGYNVKRATVSGGPYATIASNIAAAAYTDQGLTNGTIYYYVVSAVNASGASANSAQVSATPKLLPPAAPTNVKAVAGNA